LKKGGQSAEAIRERCCHKSYGKKARRDTKKDKGDGGNGGGGNGDIPRLNPKNPAISHGKGDNSKNHAASKTHAQKEKKGQGVREGTLELRERALCGGGK